MLTTRLRLLTGAFAVSTLLLTGVAGAASSSSSSGGLSKATNACIKHATSDKKICKFSSPPTDCTAAFNDALKACFAGSKGASCASNCTTKKTSCDLKAQTSLTQCKKSC